MIEFLVGKLVYIWTMDMDVNRTGEKGKVGGVMSGCLLQYAEQE